MLAEGHRKAAEDIEKGIAKLQLESDPDLGRLVIKGAWGAAFHWIGFGCETKHHRHQESHARLGRFLRGLGESSVAGWWEILETARQGGWYGGHTETEDVQHAFDHLEYIRLWATG